MENNFFFSNKSFSNFDSNEVDKNLFFNNPEDNLLHSYNIEEEDDYNNNYYEINNDINKSNELFTNSYNNNINLNLKLDNSIQLKNNLYQDNNSLKDISSIGHISNYKLEEDNINNNSSSNISNNSSTTKDKSRIKKEKEKEEINNKEINKETINKKRKPRVHLEDLNIDPEIIKDKKFETIGDKVFLSKNKILTEEDKKEIRAIRNRISAQKSRDKKKAEFILFQEQIKNLKEELKQKNLIIKNYEKICCPECKAKFEEMNQKIILDNNGGLILEEDENNSIIPNKKKSLLGKIPGLLIGIVCLIGITLCIFQYSNSNNKGIPLRNLKNIYNKSFIINATKEDDDTIKIYEEPISPKQNNYYYLNEIEEDNELLQMCHDKFIFDIYSNNKKKKDLEEKQKTGFLMKKTYNKLDPNSFCFESNTITNGNYLIKNNFTNTLPIQRDNIVLNDYISNKIISVFIKDYESLKKYSDGKLLTLKEQIEKGAKNSEDGCIYLQLILPKNELENNYETKNNTCPNDNVRYFEIRAKIMSYYNYYDRDT